MEIKLNCVNSDSRFINAINNFRVRCYGPGVEPSGPIVGAPANFTVETFSAGKGESSVIPLVFFKSNR